MATIQVAVTGRVQGVGYRWFVRGVARRLGVAGWVRNLPDGSVELVAGASDPILVAFTAALRTGPPGARVEHLEQQALDPADTLPDPFQIK